jgi:hypothetical protein
LKLKNGIKYSFVESLFSIVFKEQLKIIKHCFIVLLIVWGLTLNFSANWFGLL